MPGGSTRIAPGIWRDPAGHLHVSISELLALVNLPDTSANRAAVMAAVLEYFLAANRPGDVIEQEPER